MQPRTKAFKLAKGAAKYDADHGVFDSQRFPDDPQLQRIYDRKLRRIDQERHIVASVAKKLGRDPIPHAAIRPIIGRYGTLLHPGALAELRSAILHNR